MHELTIAEQMVNRAVEAVGPDAQYIRALRARVGALSSVNADSLEFCLRVVLDNRGLTRAEVRLERVPARVRCECGHEFETDDVFAGCPSCGGYRHEVIAGLDVVLDEVEVDDGEEDQA